MTMAAEAGQLQLNAFEPVMAHVLFENLKWMTAAMTTLRVNCVEGITANRERLAREVDSFVGVITALIPHIGYGPAAKMAKEALASHANIAELVVKSGVLTREQVDTMLSPERLTSNREVYAHGTRD
ncbi:aspartate ammonia-lyase (aspartase) [Pedosphaera parvula Ellin514]|uniref:Aspartate ammonia-lyase (Aspartase) n=1 Tax=Pedosphaera parvula (strain Ellin514) TaxID=320771 RepID=B9XS90_PEDPL|nr:aspartate ammonia-lyase (aspartase) [Pedosphaera parvula Ellin514]